MCKTQKINRRSDVHVIKVVETQRTDCATQTEKRKSEKKFQRDRNRIDEKRLFLAELPFSRIKDSQFNEELTKNKLDKSTFCGNILTTKLQKQSYSKTVIL